MAKKAGKQNYAATARKPAKPAVVPPGPGAKASEGQPAGNPGRTPEDEFDERIEIAETLLARGMRKSEIKKYFISTYSVTARTVENYLSRARERMLAKLALAKDEHKAGALAFYQAVIADKTATISEKLRAQQLSCWLLGLNSPFKVAPTNTNGDDISVDQAKAIISSLAATLAEREGAETAGEVAESDRAAD